MVKELVAINSGQVFDIRLNIENTNDMTRNNINIKYSGYITRQQKQVKSFKKLEGKKIPEDFNYDEVGSLRKEARQKLKLYRPINIGQASRISGVSPADISVLLIYMEQHK